MPNGTGRQQKEMPVAVSGSAPTTLPPSAFVMSSGRSLLGSFTATAGSCASSSRSSWCQGVPMLLMRTTAERPSMSHCRA